MTIWLSAIEVVLPDRTLLAQTLPEVAELSPAERQTLNGLGIDTVLDAAPADADELAAQALRQLFDRGAVRPHQVDALIMLEGRAPERLMVSSATRVQHDAGLSRATAFTVAGVGCVSSSAALTLARSLLLSEPSWSHIAIAYGSRPTTARRYRHPVTILGDGAFAALVSRDGQSRILDGVHHTDGRYWDLFQVEFRDVGSMDWRERCRDPQEYSFRLAVESQSRFAALNTELLERNRLKQGDLAHVVMQNLSTGAFQFYERALRMHFAACCLDNLQAYGHLGAMDIMLNLHAGMESGEFGAGDLVLVMNNSPVAAWSSVLIEI